ncbi:hypothetical protein [Alkalisalibacterium limincola]|uniref:Uncharacterized protein n=1 Tax=Alkalisalibacterium limincola TaxID=2699169 RepID=A0A5C8KNB4_9GAMM|nr:hypothetical protein [Alkalisalibacterium limincola]TXK60980.1 hypothetical protein FU658_10390 [Alkalisalibacterium limincola]
MWDFEIGKIMGLMLRTLPFLVLRVLVYFGILVAYVLGIAIGGGLGYMVGSIGGGAGSGGGVGALIGFALVSGVLYWAREYLLYMVKAAHLAVLVELLDGKPIPDGKGQLQHGAAVIRERFIESSVLFAVDRLIKVVLRAFNRTVTRVTNFLPIPGLQGVTQFALAVVNMSLTYVDEAILAHNIRNRIDNPWAGARDGMVLYAQNYRNLIKNALWLTLVVWALTFVIFLVVLAPVALVVAFFPTIGGVWALVLAALAAWSLKAALIDPFATTALVQAYFKATDGQEPNPEWAGKLESASGKFREIGAKAQSYVSRPAQPTGAAASAPTSAS